MALQKHKNFDSIVIVFIIAHMDEQYPTQPTDTPEATEHDPTEAGRNFIQRRQDDITARIEQFLQLPPGWKAADLVIKTGWLTLWSGGIVHAAEHLPDDISSHDPANIGKDIAAATLSGLLMWWRAGRIKESEKQELLEDWRGRRNSPPPSQSIVPETR